ncbi:hypothetical protein D3C80_1144930 [compost metagenome]
MDHPLELLPGKQLRHGDPVGEIEAFKAKAGQGAEPREARLLQAHLVVVVEIVDADHLMTVVAEPLRHMEADESGGTGDQIFHCRCSSRNPVVRLSPRPMA